MRDLPALHGLRLPIPWCPLGPEMPFEVHMRIHRESPDPEQTREPVVVVDLHDPLEAVDGHRPRHRGSRERPKQPEGGTDQAEQNSRRREDPGPPGHQVTFFRPRWNRNVNPAANIAAGSSADTPRTPASNVTP